MTNSPNHSQLDGAARHSIQAVQLREALAELEHQQWCDWSRQLAAAEVLSAERVERWSSRWVPYSDLSEADKDRDREYADRVIRLLTDLGAVASREDPP